MNTNDKIYFRVVFVLKVILPALGIGVIVSLFILSRDRASQTVVPFSQIELEQRLNTQQIIEPLYAGQTNVGDDLFVMANLASQDVNDTSIINMETVQFTLKTQDNIEVVALSDIGVYNRDLGELIMTGSVYISSTDGYNMTTPKLRILVDGTYVWGQGPVKGVSPNGIIDAGQMEIIRQEPASPLEILFSKRSQLVYDPKN